MSCSHPHNRSPGLLGADRDKLREEVLHLIEEYDRLDDEALDELLTAFIEKPYPTQEGQNG
jgi:D-mannonate dehydratase